MIGAGEQALRRLQPTFRRSYLSAIGRFGDQPFLSVYSARGSVAHATYAEFHARVCAAMAHLERVARGRSVVATIAGNSYEHVVYLVAALLTGRALCPINRDEGEERIGAKIRALGEPCAMVGDRESIQSLPQLALEPMELQSKSTPSGPVDVGVDFPTGRPFVLVFTSGSTGYSKIVEQTETGVLVNVDALIERHGLGPGVCVGTPLPVFHVNALEFSLFSTMLSGSRLVLWEKVLFPQFFESLRDEQVAIVSLVPPLLRSIVRRAAELKRIGCPNLRYWVSAAAPLGRDLAVAVREQLGLRVLQGYGLSEAVNFSCLMPVGLSDEEYDHWMRAYPWPSVGTALRGSDVSILDDDGRPLGPGDVGEICVGGATVMRGYRNESASAVLAGGVLHTGDLGTFRLSAAGERFYFVTGRKKEIAKRNGMTVSLREIDDVLSAFAAEAFDGIAIAFQNDVSGEEIGAVISASPWDPALEARLVAHIESMLPVHLRPRVIVRTPRTLRTPSGKPWRPAFQSWFDPFRGRSLGTAIRFFEENE